MIIDRPEWVAHLHPEGISSIDIHLNGRRLVTSGTDPQIKVWNLLPILDPAAEADPNVPKLLATISEHNGSVLVVAFNHSGQLLASGGIDNTVLLYKLSNLRAASKLGSNFENLENWKTVGSIRNHSLDVTGLAWSPNDKQLATCSMDGSILVHNITPDGGHSPAHQIRHQHNGWVKGLAFDPVGRYLASQGRNGVKVWDVECGWAQVTHQKQPFERSPETSFTLRMSWSPDGEQLLAANANSGGKPTTVLFSRQSWDATFMVGHRSSVVAAVANPRLFFASRARLAERRKLVEAMQREADVIEDGSAAAAAPSATAADSSDEVAGYDDMPSMVMACGSNDKSLTVWMSELPIPLIHCTQLHAGPVVDLAWTPDGYTLIATSSDDSISVFRFSEAELGKALTETQLKAVLQESYGEAAVAGDAADHAAVDLELAGLADGHAAAAAHTMQPAALPTVGDTPALAASAPAAAATAGAPRRVVPQPVGVPALSSSAAAAANGSAGGDALARRLMPTGGVTTGSLQPPGAIAAAAAAAAGNNRKRMHPTAVAAASGGASGAAGPSTKRPALGQPQNPQQQLVARQAAGAAAARAGAASGRSGWLLQCPPVRSILELQLAQVEVKAPHGPQSHQVQQQQQQQQGASQQEAVILTVENQVQGSSAAGGPVAEVKLQLAGTAPDIIWRDKVQGQVVAIAGNVMFSAAATSTGMLHTWRPGGQMLLPPMVLGSPPVRMSAQGEWGLQLVGADGHFTLLDLQHCQRLLEQPPPVNIGPVLAVSPNGTSLADTWVTGTSPQQQQQFSTAQTHVAVLSDASAWLYHLGLGSWLQLQPGVWEATAAAPHLSGVAQGSDAERLSGAAAAAVQAAGLAARPPLPTEHQGVWQRKEAELAIWRATVLGDPSSYHRWMQLLVNLLVQQRDMGRLKELAMDLLGPVRWDPSCALACGWTPTVLGLDKRTMLRELLIPAAAGARLQVALTINNELEAAQEYLRSHTTAPVASLRLGAASQQQQQPQQYQLPSEQLVPESQQPPPPTALTGIPPAAGSGTGAGLGRRIAPTAVTPKQQQLAAAAAAADGLSAAGSRAPLQETRMQPHVLLLHGQQERHEKLAGRSSQSEAEAAERNGGS